MRYLCKIVSTCLPHLRPSKCGIAPVLSTLPNIIPPRREFGKVQTDQYKFLTHSKIQQYFNNLRDNYDLIPEEIVGEAKADVELLLKTRSDLLTCMKELDDLRDEGGSRYKTLVIDEYYSYKARCDEVERDLFEALLPADESHEFNEAILEVSPGVGGQEAMLFAKTLFDMYLGYIDFKGWNYTLAEIDTTDLGGLRFGSILVEGEDVFKWLQFETGVHRVQRVPVTEKSGRIHTSTATVAVLPQPKDIHIKIHDKDLTIETKRATGAGGQHVNTTDSAVRILHSPSGVVVECQTSRSQIKNREVAMKLLQAKLFDIQLNSQNRKIRNMRKLQVGSSCRSDKIRTYNFNQDRITDHRFSYNFHNIEGFLKGNKHLDHVISSLIELNYVKRIHLFLESIGVEV